MRVWHANRHDTRYRFCIEITEHSVIIIQDTPPSQPPVWIPAVWSQWVNSRKSVAIVSAKARKVLERYLSAKPDTKWFRSHVTT